MNTLTSKDPVWGWRAFATLDATTKSIHLGNLQVTLTDTVGFIQDLPTELVSSFKSTLEESKHVDLLVHVIDASNPYHEEHEKQFCPSLKTWIWKIFLALPFIIKRIWWRISTPTQTPYALISAKSEDSHWELAALFLEKIKDIFESFTLRVPSLNPTRFMIWKVLRFWKNVTIKRIAKSLQATFLRENKWRLEEFYDWYQNLGSKIWGLYKSGQGLSGSASSWKDRAEQLALITPPPSVVNAYFAELYQKKSPEAATDYFAELSQELNLYNTEPSFN